MLDKIGVFCCVAGAVLGVAGFIWPQKHLGGLAIGLFLLGLLLQWLARRRSGNNNETLGEVLADLGDVVDLD